MDPEFPQARQQSEAFRLRQALAFLFPLALPPVLAKEFASRAK
jgi:hypothetical protein